jgi:hypothetical protein
MSHHAIACPDESRARLRGPSLALAVFAVTVALALPSAARATVLERMSTEEMSRRAATVVVGTVLSTSSESFEGYARTVVRVAVTDALKGSPGSVATVYVPGGQLPDGTVERVDQMPSFLPGESCAIFADGRGWVMGGYQGKVALAGGRIRANGRPVSDLAGAVRASSGTRVFGVAVTDPLAPAPALGVSVVTAGAPVITSISPGSIAAGIGARITINGSGFGVLPGSVSFFYQDGEPRIGATTIDSWADTRIVCDVPVATVGGYPASPGSDPLIVTTSDGLTASRAIDVQFGNGGYYWADNSTASPRARVTYRVVPGSVALAESLVDVGAAVWSAAGADFRFVDGGTTAVTGTMTDGRNDISWASGLPSGVIAQARQRFYLGGTFAECHVTFSTAYSWGDGSGMTIDIATVAIHELGHWLFLRDLYGSGDSGKVMYGWGSEGVVHRTLSSGDTAGIRYIYGTAPVTPDTIAPTTTSDAVASYAGVASVRLTATDNVGGSGVSATYYRLDGAAQTAGNSVSVSAIGYHTLQFWSVDVAGNVETPTSVSFWVTVPDTTPPHTTSDAVAAYAGSATVRLSATDSQSAIYATYYRLDGALAAIGTVVTVTSPGAHTLEFWSVDAAGMVETSHHTAAFTIEAVPDLTPPVTSSDAVMAYAGPAVISLRATDIGGSGVAATYFVLDGGAETAGSVVTVSSLGTHTLEFWSVDGAGNTESPRRTATFSIVAAPVLPAAPVPTAITIARSTSAVRLPKPFVLSGRLTPGGYRDPCVVEVKKPNSPRWSYSSARLAYTASGDWWYRYTPKLRGTYLFRARFAGDAIRTSSVSGVVGVAVR